jgi:protein-tyrosine phosphatase
MGLFSKKKEKGTEKVYSLLKADMHSHLLPGIDDGSPDIKTSLELIRGMQELGYSKLITTPHVMGDMYQNSRSMIEKKLTELQQAVENEGIKIILHAAAEYFLDDHVAAMLRNKEPLLTISGNLVLSEFSLAYPSHSLKDIIFEMQMQGYQPVIAHPERYVYLQQQKTLYDELKELGCLFQLNILSLTQHYGRSVNELAQYLIKKDYYDLLGTDLHHYRHLQALADPGLQNHIRKVAEKGKLRNATL